MRRMPCRADKLRSVLCKAVTQGSPSHEGGRDKATQGQESAVGVDPTFPWLSFSLIQFNHIDTHGSILRYCATGTVYRGSILFVTVRSICKLCLYECENLIVSQRWTCLYTSSVHSWTVHPLGCYHAHSTHTIKWIIHETTNNHKPIQEHLGFRWADSLSHWAPAVPEINETWDFQFWKHFENIVPWVWDTGSFHDIVSDRIREFAGPINLPRPVNCCTCHPCLTEG